MTTWTKQSWSNASGNEQAEEYLVAAIRRHLMTEALWSELNTRRISIEDLLNGRIEGADQDEVYTRFFQQWNATLGFLAFGFCDHCRTYACMKTSAEHAAVPPTPRRTR